MVSSVRARGYLVTIGLSESLQRPRLAGSAGGILLAREQKFGLKLKEADFDRAGTPKSPQQARQSMNERKLEHGSRINTDGQSTLECSIGSNIFKMPDDGLVGKVTPSAA
jgi:hypothetical protein